MRFSNIFAAILCAGLLMCLITRNVRAQQTQGPQAQQGPQDPGPRGGPAAAGGAYPTLNAREMAFFNQTAMRFMEVDSVSGSIPGEGGTGLGPTFNGNGCAQCHAQPTSGGSSPGLTSPQDPVPNPQVALATLDGATNIVPSFITA